MPVGSPPWARGPVQLSALTPLSPPLNISIQYYWRRNSKCYCLFICTVNVRESVLVCKQLITYQLRPVQKPTMKKVELNCSTFLNLFNILIRTIFFYRRTWKTYTQTYGLLSESQIFRIAFRFLHTEADHLY